MGGSIGRLSAMTGDNSSREAVLRAFLAEHDEPCPGCGYSLLGIASSVCPECGHELELTLRREQPAPRWYTVGLVGVAAAVGFHWGVLPVALMFGSAAVFRFLPSAAVALLALVWWTRGKRRMAALSVPVRSGLVSLALSLPFLLFAMTFVIVVFFDAL